MIKSPIVAPPEHIYPPDPWSIIEARYSQAYQRRAETVFALSNGYLGVRGTFDEGRPVHSLGTFINGLYESRPIHYAEEAYGLASKGQTMIAVPDATVFRLNVDDEPLLFPVANCRAYRRELDLRADTLCRDLIWSTPGGKHVHVRTSRLVSLDQRHLLVIDYRITMLDRPAPVVIRTGLTGTQSGHHGSGETGASTLVDPRLAKVFEHQVLCEELRREDGRRLLMGYRAANSGMTLGVGAYPHHRDVLSL